MRKLLAFAATALMLTSTASLAHFPEGQIFGAWQWPSTHLPNLDGDISEWDVLPAELWIDIFQTVLTAAVGIYVWLVTRTRVNAARISKMEEDLDARLDGHDRRLTRIEGAVEHGPTRDDLSRIHTRIDEVAAAIARIEGESHAAARNLDLIHQHLLERKA